MKVGNKQPLGEIIEKLTPQKRIGKESDAFAHMQTRILVLDGVDKNNLYDNTNTRSRSIYIHGTNKSERPTHNRPRHTSHRRARWWKRLIARGTKRRVADTLFVCARVCHFDSSARESALGTMQSHGCFRMGNKSEHSHATTRALGMASAPLC